MWATLVSLYTNCYQDFQILFNIRWEKEHGSHIALHKGPLNMERKKEREISRERYFQASNKWIFTWMKY